MARGFGDIDPRTNKSDRLKPEELWDIFALAKEATSWTDFRFLPTDLLPVKTHWIKIRAGKDKKETKIPKLCVSFDPDNENVPLEGTHCPYCELSTGENGSCQTQIAYYANVIVRDIQEDEPRKKVEPTRDEKKTGFKDPKTKSWTPVRVIRITAGLAAKLQSLKERNKVKGKYYDINDPKHGMDVAIKYDADAAGADKYQIDRGEQNSLDEDELEYLVYDLGDDAYDKLGRESTDQAKAEFKKLDIIGATEIDDEDEDDDDEAPRRGSKGKKRRRSEEPDEEDENDDDEDEDEEESRSSRRRRGKSKPSRSRRSSVDDDEDEDEDEDEDDSPRSRRSRKKSSGSKSSSRRSRRSSIDEDEDEDEDEAPRKSRSRRSSGSSSKTSSRRKRSRR